MVTIGDNKELGNQSDVMASAYGARQFIISRCASCTRGTSHYYSIYSKCVPNVVVVIVVAAHQAVRRGNEPYWTAVYGILEIHNNIKKTVLQTYLKHTYTHTTQRRLYYFVYLLVIGESQRGCEYNLLLLLWFMVPIMLFHPKSSECST